MEGGARLTRQRQAVYDVVRGSEDHPTARDVMERLEDGGVRLAYGTVYNALRYLAEAGLVRELTVGGGANRYDGRVERHQHVRCRRCGRIDEVLVDLPREWIQSVGSATAYRIEDEDVLLTGVCPECQSAPVTR